MYKTVFASIALFGLTACVSEEIIVDEPDPISTVAADRQLLIDSCTEDLENEVTCACMASANEDNLSPANYAKIVEALRAGEKFSIGLDGDGMTPEDEEEWGSAMGASFACSDTSNESILVKGCTDGGHSQQGCYCTTAAMKADLSPAVYLAIVEAVKSKGEGEDPFAGLTEDEQTELAFIPDAMTASCDAIGEWTGSWSEEDQAATDKQALVNQCIENGENGTTCSCIVTATVMHAPDWMFDEAVTAARAEEDYSVDMGALSPEDMASHEALLEERLGCMDTSNEAALINQCVDGGQSGSVCVCKADALKAGLSSELYSWFVYSTIEGTDMELWFEDLDLEQKNEFVSMVTTSNETCAEK